MSKDNASGEATVAIVSELERANRIRSRLAQLAERPWIYVMWTGDYYEVSVANSNGGALDASIIALLTEGISDIVDEENDAGELIIGDNFVERVSADSGDIEFI